MAGYFNCSLIFLLNLSAQILLYLSIHNHFKALNLAAVFTLSGFGLILSGIGCTLIYAIGQGTPKPKASAFYILTFLAVLALGIHSGYVLYLNIMHLIKAAVSLG